MTSKKPLQDSVQSSAGTVADLPSYPQHVVRVIVPLFLHKPLDFGWAESVPPPLFSFVEVTVNGKGCHGLVVEVLDVQQSDVPLKKLKKASAVEAPPLAEATVKFWQWLAKYTLSAPGDPLRASLMKAHVPPRPAPARRIVKGDTAPSPLTKARQKVLDTVGENAWLTANLADTAGVGHSVIQGLLKQKALQWRVVEDAAPTPKFGEVTLNEDQLKAADEMKAALGTFQPFVLDGTTGSGKTEVYFDVIEEVLKKENTGQVLVLVPEISLTPQWVQRFEKRFGFPPVLWHSSVAAGAKQRTWWQVMTGTARVIVGARSALFLPFKDLQLLVVDEEHDGSYKQAEVFRYHGRDMAVAAARFCDAPVVLASATPSLETWQNVQTGKYKHLKLPSRYGKSVPPEMGLIDLKQDGPNEADKWVSPLLMEALVATLEKGQQSLLFLNRRGVAPLLICRTCGHRYDCPRCDASLVVHGHKGTGRLTCHHCGFTEHYPETCPECGGDKLHPFGPGTRKVYEEVRAALPSARLAVADSDSVTTPAEMGELVGDLQNGKIDILIGTQMVTKGHDFPNLTLVGVLDGDMGLARGDLRAAERTFQLLVQVAGRAGRGEAAGRVLIQTHEPEHPLMQAVQRLDRDAFYAEELRARQMWSDPPFGRQVEILVSGAHENAVIKTARQLAQSFPETQGVQVLGPAPHLIKRVKDIYRYRLLVKGEKSLQGIVAQWLAATPVDQRIKVIVDVDPQN